MTHAIRGAVRGHSGDVQVARALRKDGSGRTVKQVPISKMFDVEFDALDINETHRRKIRETYEGYVSGIMNTVSVWLGFGDASRADHNRLVKAVRDADEHELFSFVMDAFRKDFKPSFEERKILVMAMEGNAFNCYSSTTLIADALSRLGREVMIIRTPTHVLISGHEYALETAKQEVPVASPKAALLSMYREFYETDVEKLLSIAYNWAQNILGNRGHIMREQFAYQKAMETDPQYADYLKRKTAYLLGMMPMANKQVFMDSE